MVTNVHAPIQANGHIFNTAWRVWWPGSLVILLVGALIHLTGYNFQLPYISTIDEIHVFYDSMIQHGTFTPHPAQFPGYPPGTLVLDSLAQDIVMATTRQPMIDHIVDAIALLRFAGACAAIAAGFIMGLLARELAGNWAGWLAMCWLVLPESTSYDAIAAEAMPQPWLVLFWALALLFAIIGLKRRSVTWPLLSVLAGLAAIFFKYSEFLSVIPGFLVTFWHLYHERRSQERRHWRHWIGVLLVQILVCAAFAVWLLFGYQVLAVFEISPPSQQFASSGLSKLQDMNQWGKVLQATFAPFMLSPLLIVLILIMGTVLYLRRNKLILAWILIAGAMVTGIALVTSYSPYDFALPRYTAPANMAAALTLALSVITIAEWLIAAVRIPSVANRAVRLLLIGGVAIWLMTVVPQAWAVATARAAPDTRTALAVWAATNLPPGNTLLDEDNHRVFNKDVGGYQGAWRDWWVGDIREHTPQEWRKMGFTYAIFADRSIPFVDPAFYRDMLALKRFPPADSPIPAAQWQGAPVTVYQLAKPQYTVDRQLGTAITLVGYDVSSSHPNPGDEVALTLYWRPDQVPKDNYNAFIHLYRPGMREIIAQADGAPSSPKRPTLTWTDRDEILISQPFRFSLPSNVSPGCYSLAVGLYNYQTGQRLTSDGQDYLEITRMCIGTEKT